MSNDLESKISAVFDADSAFVAATAELLRRFKVQGVEGLAFMFDRRQYHFKAGAKRLTIGGQKESYKYMPAGLQAAGGFLADLTGVPFTDGDVELYLCDVRGFRVGVLVDKTKRLK